MPLTSYTCSVRTSIASETSTTATDPASSQAVLAGVLLSEPCSTRLTIEAPAAAMPIVSGNWTTIQIGILWASFFGRRLPDMSK